MFTGLMRICSVPIYDARNKPDFMFTLANMQQLTQLPLYKGGASDLPPDSLATVGYAVNEYMGNQGPMASFNVLFVILVGDIDRDFLDRLSVAMMDANVQ